jgi:hypothetical protein
MDRDVAFVLHPNVILRPIDNRLDLSDKPQVGWGLRYETPTCSGLAARFSGQRGGQIRRFVGNETCGFVRQACLFA